MKRKHVWIITLVVVSLVLSVAGPSVAGEKGGCSCKKGDKPRQEKMDEMVFHKAHMLLMHQEEMGLSDEQVSKIKSLKIGLKKDLIMRKAEIEIIGVDIKALLWEDSIDTEKVNILLEKKYQLKEKKAKALVKAMADLKAMLTPEQRDMCKKSMMGEPKAPKAWKAMKHGKMSGLKGSIKGAMMAEPEESMPEEQGPEE